MRKFLILLLFCIGLGFGLWRSPSLATQGEYDSLILDFRETVETSVVEAQLKAIAQQFNVIPRLNSEFSAADQIYVIEGKREMLQWLRQSDPIKKATEYIEPNYIYRAYGVPNDPDYPKQWNLRSINVEAAWSETRGEGITVAVIDTGVSPVPDLEQTAFVGGYDFVGDRPEALDDVGHGTHVAGTIAQSTNNNYGVAGIAYKAKIMPIKVLAANGGGTVADIAEGIRFATDQGADVINLSLGGAGASQLMQEAIDYAYRKDVVIVAAAGNANKNAAAYPARYPKVIGVAATDAAGKKAPYSNYGAGIDLAAPGGSETGGILQETLNPKTGKPEFIDYKGTSMAAPHVAGVAAMVKASGVTKPAEVLQVLTQSAQKVTEDPLNHYGAGYLNAGQAVTEALKGKITVKDFFRWLRDNGYLNPRFWIDGGTVALLPKLAMVLGSYLLAFLLRNYLPFGWGWPLSSGLVFGSSGLFFLKGIYIFDLPQAPFRLLGSSLPELGNAINGNPALNPLFASVLIPFGVLLLLAGTEGGKRFGVGLCLGVASCLWVSAIAGPMVWGLGSGILAQAFLGINGLLCVALAKLMLTEPLKTSN
ncbi:MULTISPECIES: S8 family peptidase [Cyanophyceae]|uniref:S8 family peptidase n=1 Tax=Cyanophyceae TaxID=3028117 RepID=UPI00016DCB77|nr:MULTISPECIES: S8 family peptidase [Cyanophyceae]ACA99375.1 serine proteinase [Picosynechococcus sp. PCC 7002]SMH31873.1 serine protease [Picosynechococcus sp. OG1]SMQ84132.1 serine protease [Synechococcus sp. 7002]